MASIIDIARMTNVSKSTVSRVVSNSGYVKGETRLKIEQAMKDLNYTPNMFAKGMRTKRSFSIGILFPDLSNPFFAEWYDVVEKFSLSKGYLNYICITDPTGKSELKRIDDLLSRHIDGIIFFSYHKHPEVLKKLKEIAIRTPVICCDGMMIGEDVSYVCADGRKGTYLAANYLIGIGHKRIAYIKGSDAYEIGNDRYQGYKQAMEEAELPIEKLLLFGGDFKMGDGYEAAGYFMTQKLPPDAIMAATDFMAIGALNYLNQHNIAAPEQVAIIGFDNLNRTSETTPTLTTIELPIETMALNVIESLILKIENRNEKIQKVFDCRLIIRQST